jgi:RNA polymerase sigma factor (sigma-70 family)
MAGDGADLLLKHLRVVLDPARNEAGNDGQLLARWAADGDAHAFAVLVWRHGPLVWRVARNVLHHTQDAEDAFQAAFLVLARKAGILARRPSLAGWLYETAHRLALKVRAQRRRRPAHTSPRPPVDPIEEISLRDARVALAEELQRLPIMYREPILLCFDEGLTQDDAARRLDCSLSTLKRRLERGRTLLGRRLARRGLDLSGVLPLVLLPRPSLPARLAEQTLAAAGKLASGQTLTGTAAALAAGTWRLLLLQKLAILSTVLFALGGMTVLAVLGHHTEEEPTPPSREPPAATPGNEQPSRVDRNGDPLPAGAVNRIGSLRFRHGQGVGRMLYTPDAKALASVALDGFLRLWDARSGKLRWRVALHEDNYTYALAISSDGKALGVLTSNEYALVETETGKSLLRHRWTKSKDYVYSMAIAPDLRTIARVVADASQATVRLYDAATGGEKLRITVSEQAKPQIPSVIQFSMDGKMLVVAATDGSPAAAYDTTSGRRVWALERQEGVHVPSWLLLSHDQHFLAYMQHADPPIFSSVSVCKEGSAHPKYVKHFEFPNATSAAFSPDDRVLALGYQWNDIALVDTASGKELRRLHCPRPHTLVFSADGKVLAATDQGCGIAQWEVSTGKLLSPAPEPLGMVWGVHFVAGGKQLRFLADSFEWWDVKTGELVRRAPSNPWLWRAVAISPDEKLQALPQINGDIALVEVGSDKPKRMLSAHTSPVRCMAFSPDGTKLFSGGWDPWVVVWDLATGKPLHQLETTNRFTECVRVSPDGRWLAAAAGEGEDIRFWEVATSKLMHRVIPRPGPIRAIAFSSDSSRLVSVGGWGGSPQRPGEVQMWDIATGKEIHSFRGHDERVNCVAISPDGRMLATGASDKTFRLWEVASGEERKRVQGHEGFVNSVDFSPDGKLLAAASDDAPIFIWDAYASEPSSATTAKLSEEAGKQLWQQLADLDAAKAYKAMCTLIAHPDDAMSALQAGWRQTPRATRAQMQQWLKDLDSDRFPVRQQATAQLEKFAAGNGEFLRQAQQQVVLVESRRRLAQILERPDPEKLRRLRMLEVLERIGTGQARQFLKALAREGDDAELSREATASMKRLEQR